MKKLIYRYPDCEHEGDVEAAEEIVAEALKKIGSKGTISRTDWSGEDGDDAIVHFTCEEEKRAAFREAIRELL